MAQGRVQWRAFLNTVVNFRLPYKAGNFLTSWATTVTQGLCVKELVFFSEQLFMQLSFVSVMWYDGIATSYFKTVVLGGEKLTFYCENVRFASRVKTRTGPKTGTSRCFWARYAPLWHAAQCSVLSQNLVINWYAQFLFPNVWYIISVCFYCW
jgi:hypothetical protein